MNNTVRVALFIGLTLLLVAQSWCQPLDLLNEEAQGEVSKTNSAEGSAVTTPRAPKWPGKWRYVDSFWGGKAQVRNWVDWPKGVGTIKAFEIMQKFVKLCLEELKFEKHLAGQQNQPGYGITLEELLTKFCVKWRQNTPYYQNGATEAFGALGRIGGGNTWAAIFKNGWGVCGDHAELLVKMTDIAISDFQMRQIVDLSHLSPEYLDRVKVVGCIGPLNKTHGACGVLSKSAYEKAKYQKAVAQKDGSFRMVDQVSVPAIGRYDVLVYDLWAKPYIVNQDLATWAATFNADSYRSAICHHYTILWDGQTIYHSKAK